MTPLSHSRDVICGRPLKGLSLSAVNQSEKIYRVLSEETTFTFLDTVLHIAATLYHIYMQTVISKSKNLKQKTFYFYHKMKVLPPSNSRLQYSISSLSHTHINTHTHSHTPVISHTHTLTNFRVVNSNVLSLLSIDLHPSVVFFPFISSLEPS